VAQRRHLGALDGIRGLAVAAVFCFHAGFGWASGGFLGVSVFFTLSGFLITRLLLDEARRDHAIDLLHFWARRLRRLTPAALATVVLVFVLAATVLPVDPGSLRGDALAALGYFANWHFLAGGASYSDLFGDPSPLLHFWSLAIEEQFYLVFPLVVLGVVQISHPRRTTANLRLVLVGLLAASLAANVLAARAGDFDFLYYSLPTRAAELLAGALLATSPGASRLPDRRAPGWALPLGVLAVAGIGTVIATTSVTSGWLRSGWLPAFALLSVGLLVAALPSGPFASALAVTPLRALGRISYGVYLYHWPVILWLDAEATDLSGVALASLQAVVTIALATVSFWFLEWPIRQGRFPRGVTARAAAPVAIVALAVLTVPATAVLPDSSAPDFAAEARALERATRRSNAEPPGLDARPRLAYFGDSTALRTIVGLAGWNDGSGAFTPVPGEVGLGCGLTRGGSWRVEGQVYPMRGDAGCPSDWAATWPSSIETNRVDVAVLQVGPADIADRQLAGESVWRAPGDPTYDSYLRAELRTALELFTSRGVTVVALTTPVVHYGINQVPPPPEPANDPARAKTFNRILREAAREVPGVAVVDLGRWVDGRDGGSVDTILRPDGVHFSIESSLDTVGPWLGPRVVRAVARARAQPSAMKESPTSASTSPTS